MKKKLSADLNNELAALQRHHLRMASMPSPKSLVKVAKPKPCRHNHSWLMTNQQSGTGYEWCWECGAIRGLSQIEGSNGYGVRTVWCRPGAKENPYEKWDAANKRLLERRERNKK